MNRLLLVVDGRVSGNENKLTKDSNARFRKLANGIKNLCQQVSYTIKRSTRRNSEVSGKLLSKLLEVPQVQELDFLTAEEHFPLIDGYISHSSGRIQGTLILLMPKNTGISTFISEVL